MTFSLNFTHQMIGGKGGVDSQHLSITGIISFINPFILKFWVLCISCVRNCADKGRAEFPLRWHFQFFFLMFPKVLKLLDRHAENFFFFWTRRFLIFKLLWVRMARSHPYWRVWVCRVGFSPPSTPTSTQYFKNMSLIILCLCLW